jgi:hypothetical protein
MKILLSCFFIILLNLSPLHSQIQKGDNLLGASVGFWVKGSVPMLGLNFESHVADLGSGTIGLGGLFRYYSYTNDYPNGDSRKYTFTSFGFQANYNFTQIGDGKFVPYLGLVLGYNNISNTYTDVTKHGVYITDVSYTSGAWLWGQAGMRYFFSPKFAGTVRLGFGNNDFNTLELGIDFKL